MSAFGSRVRHSRDFSDEENSASSLLSPIVEAERKRIRPTGRRPPWRQQRDHQQASPAGNAAAQTPPRRLRPAPRNGVNFDRLRFLALFGIGACTVALVYTGIFLAYAYPTEPKPVLYCRTSEFYNRDQGSHNDGFVVRSQEDVLHFEDWLAKRRLNSYYFCNGGYCPDAYYGWEYVLESLGYLKSPTNDFDGVFISIQYGNLDDTCEKSFPFQSGKHIRSCLGYALVSDFSAKDSMFMSLFGLYLRMKSFPSSHLCPNPRTFLPRTFLVFSTRGIEEQLRKLKLDLAPRSVRASDGQMVQQRWIIKVASAENARGTLVTTDPMNALRTVFQRVTGGNETKMHRHTTWIVQEYTEDPLLWNGRKFSIRTWAVVLSVSPLQVLYHDGLVNMCMEPYNSTHFTRTSHLTNVQAENKEFQVRPFDAFSSLEHFQHYLLQKQMKSARYVDQTLRKRLKDIMTFAIYSFIDEKSEMDPELRNRYVTYQVMCFDFMIDSKFQVWLHEVTSICNLDSGYSRNYMPPNKRRVWDALGRNTLELAEEAFYRRENSLSLSLRSYFTSLGSFHILIDEADPSDFHSAYATSVLQNHNVTERAVNRLCSADTGVDLDL